MRADEKFNQTIESIEDLIRNTELNTKNIADMAARQSGLATRDLSTVFSYLMDNTLNNYITMRRLNAAYRFLIESPDRMIAPAVEISGYADQPTFTKAFKKQFGITPKEAFEQKDPSRYLDPITWDRLSNDSSSQMIWKEDDEVKELTVFGVKISDYEKISRVNELESFYGLPRMFSEYAYEVSEKTGRTLEDGFRYAQSLREYGGDFDIEEKLRESDLDWMFGDTTPSVLLRQVGDDETLQKVFFEKGFSVDLIRTLIDEFDATEEELLKCDTRMLWYFPSFAADEYGNVLRNAMRFSYFVRAYEFFIRHIDIEKNEYAFERYIERLIEYETMEDALESSRVYVDEEEQIEELLRTSIADLKRSEDLWMEYEDSTVERDAEEQERWSGVRIDDDLYYDPENIVDIFNDYEEENESMYDDENTVDYDEGETWFDDDSGRED